MLREGGVETNNLHKSKLFQQFNLNLLFENAHVFLIQLFVLFRSLSLYLIVQKSSLGSYKLWVCGQLTDFRKYLSLHVPQFGSSRIFEGREQIFELVCRRWELFETLHEWLFTKSGWTTESSQSFWAILLVAALSDHLYAFDIRLRILHL